MNENKRRITQREFFERIRKEDEKNELKNVTKIKETARPELRESEPISSDNRENK